VRDDALIPLLLLLLLYHEDELKAKGQSGKGAKGLKQRGSECHEFKDLLLYKVPALTNALHPQPRPVARNLLMFLVSLTTTVQYSTVQYNSTVQYTLSTLREENQYGPPSLTYSLATLSQSIVSNIPSKQCICEPALFLCA